MPRGVSPQCVLAWLCCVFWVTAPSGRMVGARSSRWPLSPATMGWGWLGSGAVFCRKVSWDAAESALCNSRFLWWEVALADQKVCPVSCPRTLKRSLSHFRGSWLTAFAAPTGTPAVLWWPACRRRWSMTSASRLCSHGLWVLYLRGREAPNLPCHVLCLAWLPPTCG